MGYCNEMRGSKFFVPTQHTGRVFAMPVWQGSFTINPITMMTLGVLFVTEHIRAMYG